MHSCVTRASDLERPTCQAGEEQLTGALTCSFVHVGEHSQGELPLIERVTSDDAQVLQGNPGHRVERDQDITAHFFNRLQGKKSIRERFVAMAAKTESPLRK